MKWALLLSLAACTDSATILSPVIEGPIGADEGAIATDLDFITLSVAHAGSPLDITQKTFTRGQQLVLEGVPFGDDLVIHMTGRVGTKVSEAAYGRTCAFQVRADGRIPAPHLFFSRMVTFGSMSTQPIARDAGVAITYSDGSGVVIGGVTPDTNEAIRQVERFDPTTGEYRALDEVAPRKNAAVALLAPLEIADEPRIAIVGGRDETTGGGATFVELIRAARGSTHQIERIDDNQMARQDLTATTLANGDVIVIGGYDLATNMPSEKVAEVTVSNGTPVVNLLRATLAHPRFGHTATRLADDVGASVLVAGGVDASGNPIAQVELYKPLSESFSDPASFNRSMIVPRRQHQAVRLPDGSVLFIGGIDINGNPVDKLELFSLDAGFTDVGTLPPNAGRIDFTATVLPDARVLLTGGRIDVNGQATNNVFIASLDQLDGTVDIVPTDRLAVARAGHQATLLCDGTVLISGGTPDQQVYERYNPPIAGRR